MTSPTTIQQATAAYFGIALDELQTGGAKHKPIVTARHVARYLERQRGLSLQDIARLYCCDHTTVLASVRHMVDRLAAGDERYVTAVTEIASVVRVQNAMKAETIVTEDKTLEALACPTCGAPVIRELQRQIAFLNERINQLGGSNGNGHS